MINADEDRTLTICQATKHAMLIPWGRFSRHLRLSERLRAAITPRCHQDATPAGDLVLEFGLASLAGYTYLEDLNWRSHPLAKDQAVQDVWDIQFRHYTTVSRCLYTLDESDSQRVQAELEDIMQPYVRSAAHAVLCQQEYLTLCGDLTGRPVSAYSSTYPPDAVFGYMANQLKKGHQAALVTLKGLRHRVHVMVRHHPGNTVSSVCLREIVAETEARLGCRPRRRTELVRQRIEAIEVKITQRRQWYDAQQAVIRHQIECQIRLGDQLQALRRQLTELEVQYQGKRVRPHSKLAQARKQKATWERQLGSALEQEERARRVCRQHQQRLETLLAERDTLLNWLAQLEVDNASNPNPVRIRWLLDGGFGDAANVTYLIEMGYDFYGIAHNGKTTQALLKQLPEPAQWTQAGVRTQVRIAANTSAVVLTNATGQLLEFAADGPYAGTQIQLDAPFVYQFPMPLFQSWELQWPVSSESVKEQVSALTADKDSQALTDALVARSEVGLPKNVAKIEVVGRLPP